MKHRAHVIGVLASLALLLAGCDWPMLQGYPDHQGYAPLEHAIGTGNVGTLTELWSAQTGGAVNGSAAVVGGLAYVGSTSAVEVFDAAGSTNCSGTPETCQPLWTAPTTGVVASPAVVGGVLYAFSQDGTVWAFDAHGDTGCSGAPKTCAPLWTATAGGFSSEGPTVGNNGVVYASGGSLFAFDASGTTNCSGTPKTCQPLWTAPAGGGIAAPAFSGGVVYTTSTGGAHTLSAFDAAGNTNCSGTPKTCDPLWTSSITSGSFSTPSVVNGKVYVGANDGNLYAFDAAGNTNCSGTPKVCSPLWQALVGGFVISSPAVANGVVYAGGSFGVSNSFRAFDAATGAPLWTAQTSSAFEATVANGVVYVGTQSSVNTGDVLAFDAAGNVGCSGSPKQCQPLVGPAMAGVTGAAVPADGRILVGDLAGTFHVFHLSGT
jgi:putative pyrroloquinoline-quinone-binding quinoprotein/putative pyrroloquinoline-quinone binding quinoprotein